MTTVSHGVHRSTTDADEWEAFPIEGVLEGDPQAKVSWLRTEGAGDGLLMTGLFTAQPSKFPYAFVGDETFQVLEGEVAFTMEGSDEEIVIGPGDLVSFPKGAKSVWDVRKPMKKFFVISG